MALDEIRYDPYVDMNMSRNAARIISIIIAIITTDRTVHGGG